MKCREAIELSERIRLLELENARLREQLHFFQRTPTLAQGIKGETLIAKLTGGVRTGYSEPHDLTVASGARLEVKISRLNKPNTSATLRWNWHNVLGNSNNKKYDYLVLIGEKDPRYENQYPRDLAYVLFLVPRSDVDHIRTGKNIAINTNLARIRAPRSLALRERLVTAEDRFMNLLRTAEPT